MARLLYSLNEYTELVVGARTIEELNQVSAVILADFDNMSGLEKMIIAKLVQTKTDFLLGPPLKLN